MIVKHHPVRISETPGLQCITAGISKTEPEDLTNDCLAEDRDAALMVLLAHRPH